MMKQQTFIWDLLQPFQPASPDSCKTQATFSNSICPKPRESKESLNEILVHILLPWPWFREPPPKKVGLEPSPDRGSDKLNMLKQRRNTQQSKLCPTTWTHIWIPALKDRDLEHSAKGGIIGPDSQEALTDHPEACILNNLPSKSHTK